MPRRRLRLDSAALAVASALLGIIAIVSECGRYGAGVRAFRIYGSDEETDYFVPYEEGFVGKTNDPTADGRERVNQGYDSHIESSDTFLSPYDNRLRSCPDMIGPIDDRYYCRGREYGYCDRRSGTCFCNDGYEGQSCERCASTHVGVGGLCYPRKSCPNDCSAVGRCDAVTGLCECGEFRTGPDCSELICSALHDDDLCVRCDDQRCLECVEGYGVVVDDGEAGNGGTGGDESGGGGGGGGGRRSSCRPCARFDPRCAACDAASCLSCVDLLLTSIRRSGPRALYDRELPFDERERELSEVLPFGSQSPRAFDEAEAYFLVDESLRPLKDSAVSCHQGLRMDASFECATFEISNVVCGNRGTVTFLSPTYSAVEGDGHIRLTVRRTGGGAGEVSVRYDVQHISTNDGDVTATARYTTDQTLTFQSGEVQKSFLVTVHDDRVREMNETFLVALSSPKGGAVLGNQFRTVVTIIDDDELRTCSGESHVAEEGTTATAAHRRAVAGDGSEFTIVAGTCGGGGERQVVGGDRFLVAASERGSDWHGHNSKHGYYSHGDDVGIPTDRVYGSVSDLGDGSYSGRINATRSGNYDLHIYQLLPGGLTGTYHRDAFLDLNDDDGPEAVRVDAVVNFTWGRGGVGTNFGTDFASAKWEGFVLAERSGPHAFGIDTTDNVRLFVDGILLIDAWGDAERSALSGSGGSAAASASGSGSEGPNTYSATHDLKAGEFHELTLHYRELEDDASVKLTWSSEGQFSTEVVPSSALYYKEHVRGSPFEYTVISSEADAGRSRASGRGLYEGTAGRDHVFTITPNDAFGNFRGDFGEDYDNLASEAFGGNDLMSVRDRDGYFAYAELLETEDFASGDGGSSSSAATAVLVPVDIVYNQTTRKFDCSYVPRISGTYSLSVTLSEKGSLLGDNLSGKHIYGSPFRVTTSPDRTFARSSVAFGGFGNCMSPGGGGGGGEGGSEGEESASSSCPGVRYGLAGEPSTFTIRSFDAHGNARRSGGDAWEITLRPEDGSDVVIGALVDHENNGKYDGSVIPLRAGVNYLSVALNGVHARDSPFEMTVRSNRAHGPSCFVMEDLRNMTFTALVTSHVTVRTVDEWGNPLSTNDAPYYDSTIEVLNVGPEGQEHSMDVVFRGDGTVRVAYRPVFAGENVLSVKVDGLPVRGSPFAISVVPGEFSLAEAYGPGLSAATAGEEGRFVVQTKDANGDNKTTDEVEFEVYMVMESLSYRPPDYDTLVDQSGWGLDAEVSGRTSYIGEGRYEVSYNATVSGTYRLSVTSSDAEGQGGQRRKHIAGSPFAVDVSPSRTDARRSVATGTGTREGVAGVVAPVRIYPRDIYGNFVPNDENTGAVTFGVSWSLRKWHRQDWEEEEEASSMEGGGQLMSSETRPSLQYGGNGMYSSDHVPMYAGEYELTATMLKPGGLTGRYYASPTFEGVPAFVARDEGLSHRWGIEGPVYSGSPDAPQCDDDTAASHEDECFLDGKNPGADGFSVEWSGKILGTHREEYSIDVQCEEGGSAQVVIEGEELIPWGGCDGGGRSGSVLLDSSSHRDIVVRYRKDGVFADARPFFAAKWSSPSTTPRGGPASEIIPQDRLYSELVVSGRTYSPLVVPNVLYPPKSTAVGAALRKAVAGADHSFVVECRDGYGSVGRGNLQVSGESFVAVHARSGSDLDDPSFEGTVVDHRNGTYAVRYYPKVSGVYSLSVTVRDEPSHGDLGYFARDDSVSSAHVRGSPFRLLVEPGPVDPAMSHLITVEEEGTIVAQVEVERTVELRAKDKHGNLRAAGGDIVLAKIAAEAEEGVASSTAESSVDCDVIDARNGTYFVRFVPLPNAGVQYLVVSIVDDAGNEARVDGSPYVVDVLPGAADANHTHVSSGETYRSTKDVHDGTVWSFSSRAGNRRRFEVVAKDKFGNLVNRGGDRFFAMISGDTNIPRDSSFIEVSDLGDGRYFFEYSIPVPGKYEVTVALLSSRQGLLGEYYTNGHLSGVPSRYHIDEVVDISGQKMMANNSVYSSVRWTGYISFPHAGVFTFQIRSSRSILWIDDAQVIDTAIERAGTFLAQSSIMYQIRLECFESGPGQSMSLEWSSSRSERHRVPSQALFNTASHILGSPFQLTVTA